jgi:hypothetical protein
MDTNGKFYLGRLHDLKTRKTSSKPLLYDPEDLNTHGVVLGMTGSGKTALCITLLEEAALQGIPAIMIDPKGDITNALLHFPDLLPKDFEPWINPDAARREGKSLQEAAADDAKKWTEGLAEWDISKERIQALTDAAEFAVYTPGSNAGLPVSILASLQAPKLSWEKDKEAIRERISSTVTAILGLVGFEDIDPVKSREHILLANLFELAWSKGKDLELSDLIMQVQNPPLPKLGVFPIDEFFPPKARAELALRLNNILAAPSFQTWMEGQSLDMASLLFTKGGKPRHCVFVLSHLSDAERMFIVTLIYSAVETWMRTLGGSNELRAIIYFDEIYGYLPPVAEPPSKAPMMRLLKQARAFGIAQLLATQNTVDVDYKGLSNIGTWFIGKLQTQRDKDRLLDGLEGVAEGGLNRSEYSRMMSALDKRVFLLHNVHEKKPQVFHTRFAMNYLPGPLTRAQIPALNDLAGAKANPSSKQPKQAQKEKSMENSDGNLSSTQPAIPAGVQEVFLPATLSLEAAAEASKRDLPANAKRVGMTYRPGLLAQAQVRFAQRKYNLDSETRVAALVSELSDRGLRWEDYSHEPFDERRLESRPQAEASFSSLQGAFADSSQLKRLEQEFIDWVYRNSELQVWANDALKQYGGSELSREKFTAQCEKAAETLRETEIARTKQKFEVKLKSLERKLEKEKRELTSDEQEVSQRKMEEMGTHLENVIGLFGGSRRRLTTSLTKRRLTANAQSDVEDTKQTISALQSEMQDISNEIQDVVEEIDTRWDQAVQEITQIPLTPARSDIYVSLFAIAWLPHHRVDVGGREVEIPAFE